jgi:phosphate transport system substrate-binding protein
VSDPSRFLEALSARPSFMGATLLLVLASCGDPPDPYRDDLPTRGHVLLMADEDLRSLVEAQEYVFESIYKDAQLDIRYLPEAELLQAVMNDSVRCWIASVGPGGEQEAYYAKRPVVSHVVPICTDAVAIVVNKNCTMPPPTIAEIRTLLSTEDDKSGWGCNRAGGTTIEMPSVLFAGARSGVARMLVDSLHPNGLSARALPSIEAVVAQVEADINSVGFLSFSAISDLDNPRMKALRDRVKLLAIRATDTSTAILPSQSTLADGSYPLRRPVYMILAEGKSGLGTGFVSFVANPKGQRIFLKQGIAPSKVPPRDVEFLDH